jgi:hypothetical protein
MRQSTAERRLMGRPLILLSLAFVVGTGIGWAATRPFAATASQRVSDLDYVAVVAQLFQRDHNEEVARERLALLGSPTILIEQSLKDAQSGKLKDQSDRLAVESLAKVLAPSSSAGTNSANPVATAPQSGQLAPTPVSNAATRSSGSTSTGQASLLGPVAAFILAFALGMIVLLRTAGLSLPLVGALSAGLAKARLSEGTRGSSRSIATLRTGTPPLRRVRHLDARLGDVALEENVAADDDESVEERTPARSGRRSATMLQSRPSVRTARRVSFQSSYRLGDEPYDEIHPITDPATGTLVAACGLSSALKLESTTAPRYYAFTAWVQDYLSGEQLQAVGLVPRWALDAEGMRIDEWVREGQVEEVLPVHRGTATELKTDTLTTEVSIVDAEFGGSSEPDDHFTRLTVRFDVRWDRSEEDV